MVEFLCLFVTLVCCIVGAIIGSVNQVKGPKGALVKDETTANWLKEIDGPEEPLTDIDFKRLKRSYKKSLTGRPFYAMLFLVAAIMAMVVGWMTEFEAVHIVLSILMLAVAAVILVVANLRNKKIFDKERENFTKKKAIVISTENATIINTPEIARYTGNLTTQAQTMYIGVCNRDGSPRIHTIPILADLYAIATEVEKYDVIMYKGNFSAMMAFKTKEEAAEEELLKEETESKEKTAE